MESQKRILLILVIAAAVCQLGYIISSKGLREYYVHNNERMQELYISNTDYDVLFLGSSRTHTGINPAMVDSICSVNSYNGGVEGGNIMETAMGFEAYLQTHPAPRFALLTIDLGAFNLTRKFFNHTLYFPFLDNKILDSTLSENGHSTTALHIIPFLALTEYDDYTKNNAIKGWLGGKDIPSGDYQYKGFLSNTEQTINYEENITERKPIVISEEAKHYLDNIITICREKKIKLAFSYAPEYKKGLQKKASNADEIFKYITQKAEAGNIVFLRHDELDICTDPKMFANPGHLNKAGAEKYSTILAEELKPMLQATY